MTFRKPARILQTTAALLVLTLIINLAIHGRLGAVLEATALFLTLAIAINLAVYGWLDVVEVWWDKEVPASDGLVHLLSAAVFTVMAVGAWYALCFVVRPFG